MTTQLNVSINADLKQAFKLKCEVDETTMEVALTNLLADFVGQPRFRMEHHRIEPPLIGPLDPEPDWCPEIEGVSFSKVRRWLQAHPEADTNVLEIWTHCFRKTLRRSPQAQEIKTIGNFLRRNGWSKTRKVSSRYRANRLYGRSTVFVRQVPEETDLLV